MNTNRIDAGSTGDGNGEGAQSGAVELSQLGWRRQAMTESEPVDFSSATSNNDRATPAESACNIAAVNSTEVKSGIGSGEVGTHEPFRRRNFGNIGRNSGFDQQLADSQLDSDNFEETNECQKCLFGFERCLSRWWGGPLFNQAMFGCRVLTHHFYNGQFGTTQHGRCGAVSATATTPGTPATVAPVGAAPDAVSVAGVAAVRAAAVTVAGRPISSCYYLRCLC
eukprot:GHVU01054732.1.p1 GENE.GHVU01054732.1~~GHVU01054732.1.p1  ORF type:complete len:224 (+),score=14.38 GHVU01054732.1:268-939(+)